MRRPAGTNATSKRGIERFRRHGRTVHVRPDCPGSRRRESRRTTAAAAIAAKLAEWAR